MRTKEEIIDILSKRKIPPMVASSSWGDLIASLQSMTQSERSSFIELVASGSAKKVGEKLKEVLLDNAKERAIVEVNTMFSDNSLSLTELDELI